MKIKDFEYIMIVEGGGWGYIIECYGITKDKEVFNFIEKLTQRTISKIPVDIDIKVESLGYMDKDSEFEPVDTKDFTVVFDAPRLLLYKVSSRKPKIVYEYYPHDSKNPKFITDIEIAIREHRVREARRQREDEHNHIVVGEVKSEGELKALLNMMCLQSPIIRKEKDNAD